MRNRNRKIVLGVSAAALVVGGVAGVAGIASADPSTTGVDHVDGFEAVDDDFNDHEREAGVLCDGCENSADTDLVTLWQSILAADGYLSIDKIDGDFGHVSANATAAWQQDRDLTETGEVDRDTWATADDKLEIDSDGYTVQYIGDEGGHVSLERDPDEGEYMMFGVSDPEGEGRQVVEDEGLIWLFEESIVLEPAT